MWGGVIRGAPPPPPRFPQTFSLCSWCVEGPSGAPSTNLNQLLESRGSRSQAGLAFMVPGGGGAGSLPLRLPWSLPLCAKHLSLLHPGLVGMGARWDTGKSLGPKPPAVHYPSLQISLSVGASAGFLPLPSCFTQSPSVRGSLRNGYLVTPLTWCPRPPLPSPPSS